MRKIPDDPNKKQTNTFIQTTAVTNTDILSHLAFNNSLQANIIYNVGTAKIITANKAACKLFGYSKKELLSIKRSAVFNIKERSFKKMLREITADGQSVAVVTAIKKSGKNFPCEIKYAVFIDGGIKKAIASISDMSQSILKQKNIDISNEKIVADNIVLAKSKQKNIDAKKEKIVVHNIIMAQAKSDARLLASKERLLIECKENFNLVLNSSSDIIYDINLVNNEVIVNDAYEKEFGYETISNNITLEDWSNNIHADDKQMVMQDYHRAIVSEDTGWKYNYRFLKADNSVANILSSGIILRNTRGKAYRMIGSMQDISKQTILEEKLEREIKLKEKQIAEASDEARETERSDIGKELHDNVNQLLGASKMYLEMARLGGENSKSYLARSSEYTITAIEEIRKLTKGLTMDTIKSIGLCESIINIARDTMEINPVKISCALESIIEHRLNDKFKLNLFRIVQEQMSNILTHAKATQVTIGLSQNKKSVILSISDNGVGFDTSKKSNGIGISNIISRTELYNGTAKFKSQLGKGCSLDILFPVI